MSLVVNILCLIFSIILVEGYGVIGRIFYDVAFVDWAKEKKIYVCSAVWKSLSKINIYKIDSADNSRMADWISAIKYGREKGNIYPSFTFSRSKLFYRVVRHLRKQEILQESSWYSFCPNSSSFSCISCQSFLTSVFSKSVSIARVKKFPISESNHRLK